MILGDKINTSMGEGIILEESKIGNYLLILIDNKIVKGHRYFKSGDKFVWENGEYYSSLHDYLVTMDRLILDEMR